MPRSLIPGICALLIAATATAGPVGNAAYDKACRRTAALAASLQSYDLTGKLSMSNNVRGREGGMGMEADLAAAARWPDLLLSDQSGDMFSMDLGTGPQGAWFYVGQLGNAFMGEPATLTRDLDGADELDLTAGKIFNFYSGIVQFLLPADLLVTPDTASDTLTVGGRRIPCLVFTTMGAEVVGEDDRPVEGPRRLHYDPDSGLVLQSQKTMIYRRQGVDMEQDITYALTDFTLNGPVDESRFTFEPPARTRIVDQLELLTNPDAMTGQAAPDITFTDLDGNELQLSSLRGQPVFIDFWATWCPPCRQEMPHIETLYHELGASGKLRFIAASSEDPATIRKFLARNPYSFPIVTVDGAESQSRFKTTSIPAGFVIDAAGIIRAHMIGAQSEAQLRAAFAKAGVR